MTATDALVTLLTAADPQHDKALTTLLKQLSAAIGTTGEDRLAAVAAIKQTIADAHSDPELSRIMTETVRLYADYLAAALPPLVSDRLAAADPTANRENIRSAVGDTVHDLMEPYSLI
jgi:hypothetical protein